MSELEEERRHMLHTGLRQGDLLVENTSQKRKRESLLVQAIEQDDLQKVESLLRRKRTNVNPQRGSSPLLVASIMGSNQMVRLLVKAKADASQANGYGETALHIASENGNLEVVKTLVDCNATLSAITRGERKTALHLAAQKGHLDTLEVLIRSGAKINAKADGGATPLHLSIKKANVKVITTLINAMADVNAVYDDGSTALHRACETRRSEVVQALIAAGANMELDAGGETPLHFAVKSGNIDIVLSLVQAGANTAARTYGGHTALQLAERIGWAECQRILANPSIASELARPHDESEVILLRSRLGLFLSFLLLLVSHARS